MTLRIIVPLDRSPETEQEKSSRVRLIKIRDGEQANYCQRCLNSTEILFWNGTIMTCVPCEKGTYIARKHGVNRPDAGLSFSEFVAVLSDLWTKYPLPFDQFLNELTKQPTVMKRG